LNNLKIVWKDPKDLKVAPTNVRMDPITDEEKEIMKLSVMTEGIKEPIIINKDNEIVSGALRWSAAIANDLQSIPCILTEFKDKYEERITCFLQDDLHHPISQRAKYHFVKKCVKEDNMTFDQIAHSIGKTEYTIRNWSKFEDYPEIIASSPKHKQLLLEAPAKKKKALQVALSKGVFKNDFKKATQLIDLGQDAPLSVLEGISKDSQSGLNVDVDYRKYLINVETSTLEIKIPRKLDILYRKKLKELNLDFTKATTDLIQKFVNGETIL
jgi:hypothetical protein